MLSYLDCSIVGSQSGKIGVKSPNSKFVGAQDCGYLYQSVAYRY